MVAIVTGNGLGLNTGSLNLPGSPLGTAVNGRGGDSVYLNGASGNLVVQLRDEYLATRGVDASLLRTYNSQGELSSTAQDGDNGDGWRMGVVKSLSAPSGGVNAAGSTLVRTDGDGSTSVYHYDAASQRYLGTDGEGAHDSIVLAADGTAVWTDAASGAGERYDARGRLLTMADIDGNLTRLTYNTNGQVSRISQPNGDVSYLDYDGVRLTQVRVVSAGATSIRNRYAYDELGRLSQVTLDLSPDDASIADGNVYTTAYTYDGASTRLASIAQSDGTRLGFTYADVGGRYRLASVSDALGGVTGYSYDLGAGTTEVTDPTGAVTTFAFDAAGQLTSVLRPAVDGVRIQNAYEYDADGNLVGMVDGNGQSVAMTYDARGNLLTRTDALGQTVTRTYDANNRVLTEAAGNAGDGLSVNRYVYDGKGHLRFAIDGSGAVLEHRYNVVGDLIAEIRYAGAPYDLSALGATQVPAEGAMTAWSAAQGQQFAERIDYAYDFRGQLSSATSYAAYDANGKGVGAPSITRYVYDQRGRLLTRTDPVGPSIAPTDTDTDQIGRVQVTSIGPVLNRLTGQFSVSYTFTNTSGAPIAGPLQLVIEGLSANITLDNASGMRDGSPYVTLPVASLAPGASVTVAAVFNNPAKTSIGYTLKLLSVAPSATVQTSYAYDALDRLLSTVDALGNRTSHQYDDAGRRTVTKYANGLASTEAFDAVGRLVSATQSDGAGNTIAGTVRNKYDAAGRLAETIDANGLSTLYLYDAAGRQVGTIDAAGQLTEAVHDANGNLVRLVAYATPIEHAQLQGVPNLAALRPASSPDDRVTRQFHDAAGRLVYTVDPLGYVSGRVYDGVGNLAATTSYAAALDGAQLAGAAGLADIVPQVSQDDRSVRYFHDGAGRALGQLDAEGYLTVNRYDGAGNLSETIRYATAADPALRAAATLAQLVPAEAAADIHTRAFYDAQGRQTGSIDGEGYLTEMEYDLAGNLSAVVRYATAVSATGATVAAVRPQASAVDQRQVFEYDGMHRLAVSVDVDGTRTVDVYDAVGSRLSRTTAAGTAQASTSLKKYDLLGRVGAELSAAGAALLSGEPLHDAAVWAQYGTAYQYDAGGRLIDAQAPDGSRTTYFYGVQGRLTHTVNALGEVHELAYDTFGEVTGTTVYANRIDTAGLQGGSAAALTQRLAAIADAGRDTVQLAQYDARGALLREIDALGQERVRSYDAFGDVVEVRSAANSAVAKVTSLSYDRRGLLTTEVAAAGALDLATSIEYDAFGREISRTDARGNTTVAAHDRNGRVVVQRDRLNGARSASYDAFDRVLTQTDANGNQTRYAYDDKARSVTVTTADGISTSATRDAAGHVVSIVDGKGAETRYSYDADGKLLNTTDALGNTLAREYDAGARLVASIDENGVRTEYRYDAANRLLEQVVDVGGLALSTRYAYDTRGEVIAVTDPAGILTTTAYDAGGQVVRTVRDPDGLGLYTEYSHDALGQVLDVTHGGAGQAPQLTRHVYDAAGRRVGSTVDPDGLNLQTFYSYDENGNVTSVTGPNGGVTMYRYDAEDRVLSETSATGAITTFAYDANGNRTAVGAANGATTLSSYDAANRLLSRTDANGHTTSYAYDGAGNLASSTDALGATTQFSYDAVGRLVRTIDALGNATTYAYDAAGNRTMVADAIGATLYRYDAANRLVGVTDPLSGTASYRLDADGRRIAATDARGAETAAAYDAQGQLVAITDALGNSTAFAYDAFGNQVSSTDANGRTSYRYYDSANRLLRESDAAGNTTSYSYDAAGNRIRAIDPNGVVTDYAYDADNRLVSIGNWVTPAAAAPQGDAGEGDDEGDADAVAIANPSYLTIRYEYDAVGNLACVIDRNGGRTLYGYDGAGQLRSVQDAAGGVVTHDYDAVGNRVRSTDPNGNFTTFIYDALRRQVGIVDALGRIQSSVLDAHGNRVQTTDQNGHGTWYAYDANDRLVSTTDAQGHVESYEYDAAGNRTAVVDKRGNITRYTYDAASRLVGARDALGAGETYTYDGKGNLVSATNRNGNTATRAYDGANRLASVTDALGNTTAYEYDASGNLVRTTDANGHAVAYQYDELNRRIGETTSREVVSETFDPNWNLLEVSETQAVVTRTVYDGNGNVVEFVDGNGNRSWYQYDALGRVTSTGNDAAGQVASFEYDAAGNLVRRVSYYAGPDDAVAGASTTYGYDALNRRIATTDSLGHSELNEYDAAGNVVATIDRNGNRTGYRYDDLNRLVAVVDALGASATSEYDAIGNLVAGTDRTGARTTYAYDAANRLLAGTDALGNTTRYAYDGVGNRISETDRTGGTRIMGYDAANRLVSKRDALGKVETYGYDGVGNRTSYTNARGYASQFTYDAQGRLTREIGATGARITYEYDGAGNRIAVQQDSETFEGFDSADYNFTTFDRDGIRMYKSLVSYEYDAANRQVAQIGLKGQNLYEQFTYDTQGNRLTSGDAVDPTRYEYDTENRLVGIVDPEGNRTAFEYDAAGNRTAMVDPNGNRTEYRYDALNRLVATVDPTGHADTVAYDAEGNQLGATDRNGNTTRYEYDAGHRLVAVIAPDGLRTEYVLDAEGRRLAETVAAGTSRARTTRTAYDQDGRVLRIEAPDGSIAVFEYDQGGNAVRRIVTAPTGQTAVTQFEYDADNRLVATVTDPDGLAIAERQVWNGMGQLIQKIDGGGHVTNFAYDRFGNLALVRNSSEYNVLESYEYNEAGDLVHTYSKADGDRYYTYDLAHRMLSSSMYDSDYHTYTFDDDWKETHADAFSYDPAGNLVALVDGDGNVTNHYYDVNNRLVATLDGDNVLHEFDYDAAGNKIAERLYMDRMPDAHDAALRPAGSGEVRTYAFAYDAQNRLVRIEYPAVAVSVAGGAPGQAASAASLVVPVETRTYDVFGNLVEATDVDGGRTVSYYDASQRRVAQVDRQGKLTQYDYDVNGKLIEQRVYAVALDPRTVDPNVSPDAPAGQVTVTSSVYDGAGRRVEERVAAVMLSSAGVAAADITSAAHASAQATVTQYRLDRSGNVIREISAPGRPEQQIKYAFYDANNQVYASIDARRSLTLYAYGRRSGYQGGEGFLIGRLQFGDPLDASIDLDSLGGSPEELTSFVETYEPANVKGELYTYDDANRLDSITSTSGESGWNIETLDEYDDGVGFELDIYWGERRYTYYYYDANGNQTAVEDDRYDNAVVTKYDALGRVTAIRQRDGSVTRQVYDAAGNVVMSFSGELTNPSEPVTSITASLKNGVQLSYALPAPGLSSYVVWDTVSHDLSETQDLGSYAHRTSPADAGGNLNGSARIPAVQGQLYYRVVTVDAAGNTAYSSEQTVSASSDVQDVQILRSDGRQYQVRIMLGNGASAPVLRYGSWYPGYAEPMTLAADGYYEASISAEYPDYLTLAFDWLGADGNQNSSETSEVHAGPEASLMSMQATERAVGDGISAAIRFDLPPDAAASFKFISANWRPAGSNYGFATTGGAQEGGYSFTLGENGSLRAGQSYEVVLTGVDAEGNKTALGSFVYTPTGVEGSGYATRTLLLARSGVGDAHLVIVNGHSVPVGTGDGTSYAAIPADGEAAVTTYHTRKADTAHSTALVSSPWQVWVPNVDASGVDRGAFVTQGHDLAIKVSLAATEAASLAGGLHFAWRDSGSAQGDGTAFANDVVMSANGTDYTHALAQVPLPAKSIDYKIWYTDANGNEVIVEWSQARTDASTTRTGRSDIVLARELGGRIDDWGFTPGFRTGRLEPGDFLDSVSLLNVDTGLAGGQIGTNPIERGYVRRNAYDAMNHLIGSTGDDGVWTDYGVDLRGNAVTTQRRDVEHDRIQDSYAEYDLNGRITAQNGPAFTTADGTLARTVVRYAYDAHGNLIKQTDALGATTTMEYDAFGRLLTQTDALGNSKRYAYDSLGHLLSQTDENGNATTWQYGAGGDRILQTDAAGVRQAWRYDGFGRVSAQLDGDGNVLNDWVYDNQDRVVRNGETSYEYSSANGYDTVWERGDHSTGERATVYDWAGRIVQTYADSGWEGGRQERLTAHQYDTYGNLISKAEWDGEGSGYTSVITNHTMTRYVYGEHGRLLSTIDPDGSTVNYGYDSLGRKISETGDSGRHIAYSYDEAGHLVEVNDIATGTVTRYGYDANGRQVRETVSTRADAQGRTHQRDIATTFDALGRVVHWEDAATGMQETVAYDAVGNRLRLQGSGPDAAVDHGSDFDAAGRVVALRENGAVIATYTYDAAGNRATYTTGGVTTSYTYDTHHRVLTATGGNQRFEWTYDQDGNVSSYSEYKDGAREKVTQYMFDFFGNNVEVTVATYKRGKWGIEQNDSTQRTYNTFDAGGRLLTTSVRKYDDDNDNTYYYRYTYASDGRQLKVDAYGDARGNATFTYDVNENLVRLDQGKGDGLTRNEFSTFVYGTDGKILAKYHDDGESAVQDQLDYVYVQGNAVAHTGMSIEAGGYTSVLDSGNYALFRNIDGDNPGIATMSYTVQAGDTLQGIADSVYGNRSMWYLIAEANGMRGDEALVMGQILAVPSTADSGPVTADTHAVYSQDEVVGSSLPNLQSPPPSGQGCSGLLQVLVVIVAVVVMVYTAGAAGAAMGATVSGGGAAAAGTAASVFETGLAVMGGTAANISAGGMALAAGVGGAVGSVASQGVAIATGLQEQFSWKEVGLGALGGVVTAGVGAYAQTSYAGASLLKGSAVGRAAVSSTLNQGLAVATHLQDDFSWRSVGAAAVAAGISSQVGSMRTPGFIANAFGGTVLDNPFAANLARQTIAGTAGAVAQQWLATGEVNFRAAAAGAIGNVFGDALSRSLAYAMPGSATQPGSASGRSPGNDQRGLSAMIAEVNETPERNGTNYTDYGYEQARPLAERLGLVSPEMWIAPNSSSGSGGYLEFSTNLRETPLAGEVYQANATYHRGLTDSVAANTNASAMEITDAQVDAAISRGETSGWDAASYAVRVTAYKAWNFVTAGFVERHDARIIANANGRLSNANFWKATAIDGGVSAASMFVAGRVGGYVAGRVGSGYAGAAVTGAAVGGAFDLTLQGGQNTIHFATNGQSGSHGFSGSEFATATAFGGVLGVGGKYLSEYGHFRVEFATPQPGTLYSNPIPLKLIPDNIRSPFEGTSETLLGGNSVNAKYGSIPSEHHWRYDRYENGPSANKLAPDEWYAVAQRAWANNAAGSAFEQAVRQDLNAPLGAGSKPFSIQGFIPDLPVGTKYGVTDIKNVINLSNSDQLRAFHQYAVENKLPFNSIIGPRTESISEPLLNNIRQTGGSVIHYDPGTRQFTNIHIGTMGPWNKP